MSKVINMDNLLPEDVLAMANARMRSAVDSGKYKENDWLDNIPYTRKEILDKIGRHYDKRRKGDMADEDGSHAIAILCNAMMLAKYEIDGIGLPLETVDIANGLHCGRSENCVNQTAKARSPEPDEGEGEKIQTEEPPEVQDGLLGLS